MSACYHHEYRVAGMVREERPALREWRSYLMWGLIDLNEETDLRRHCPQGIATIENQVNIFNGALLILTLGVYASSTAKVYCRQTDMDDRADPL